MPKPGLDLKDVRLSEALGAVADLARPVPTFSSSDSDEHSIPVRNIGVCQSGGPEPDDIDGFGMLDGMQTHDEPQMIEAPSSGDLRSDERENLSNRSSADRDFSEHWNDSPVPGAGSGSGEQSSDDQSSDDSNAAPNGERRERPWAETAQPGQSWQKLIAAAELSYAASNSDGGESSEIVPGRPESSEDSHQSATGGETSRSATTKFEASPPAVGTMGLALTGAALLLLSIGFWIGRMTGTVPPQVVTESAVERRPAAETAAEGTTGNRVEGRITYQDDTDEISVDEGARIILLPVDREGSVKIPHSGLRESDSEVDRNGAEAIIDLIGGAAAFADKTGRFSVTLKKSGEYVVLILSNSASRPDDAPMEGVTETLTDYFERPSAVLGDLAFRTTRIRLRESGVCPLDCTFR